MTPNSEQLAAAEAIEVSRYEKELANRLQHLKIASLVGGELYGWDSQYHCVVRVDCVNYDVVGPVYRAILKLISERDAERRMKDAAIRAAEMYCGLHEDHCAMPCHGCEDIVEADALLRKAKGATT